MRLLLLLVLLFAPAWGQTPEIYEMRSDQGIMEDFGPTGAAWMPDGHVFVTDRRYNLFHVFDTQGRRFRALDYPLTRGSAVCNYSGVGRLNDQVMYAIGPHAAKQNDVRFLTARSVVHKVQLISEGKFSEDSCQVNLDPDTAFAATGYYGESVPKEKRILVSGLTMDPKHNRVFVACARPLAPDGTVLILQGQLDKFIAADKSFTFEVLKTGLKPETDPATGQPYFLSDIEYVEDKGIVMLMTSFSGEDLTDQMHFGSNQLWFLKGGLAPAKPILKGFAPGNRATGLSLKPEGDKWKYTAVIVCDNDMEDTKIPSRMVLLKGIQLPLK